MFNNSSNLYGGEWLALVFSNRNKNYGAYVLRKQSSSIMVRALVIVVPIFLLLFIGPMLYAQLKPKQDIKEQTVVEIRDIDVIHEMKPDKPKEKEVEKELPKAESVIEKVKTVNLSSNIVVVDKVDIAEPPTSKDVENAVVASVTADGIEGKGNAKAVGTNDGGDGNGTAKEGSNEIFETHGVEEFPEFPGGLVAWSKFIQRNLRYPYMAQETGVQGKVFVSFVIEKDGSVSDVSLVRGIGAGCDEEAMRVIKKSPKWKPGKQNKQTVRVRYNMPINYTINQ